MADESETRPGYFDSPIAAYPGYIQFPHPFTLDAFGKWWKRAVEPVLDAKTMAFASASWEWEGAKHLLLDHGEWAVKSISRDDVVENRVPLEVVSWVEDCQDAYIWPMLSQKKRRRLSTLDFPPRR